MQFHRYFIFVLFVGVLLTVACNLAVVTPTPMPSLAVIASPLILPTNTETPTPIFTPTVIQPTPTLTLFYNPTVTSTPSWTGCPLMITRKDTRAGDLLHILRCEDNLEYDLGPFSKGVYAVGPNGKFIVYVTNDGLIYTAKIGDEYLSLAANLARERFFIAINKKVLPKFAISFIGEAPYYRLVLLEEKYGQKNIYNLPVRIEE